MQENETNINGTTLPIISVNTMIIGSGAAALNAAVTIHDSGQEDIAIVTDNWGGGTSNNAGSDKQTYYKLSLAGNTPDSPSRMAEDLFNGGTYRVRCRNLTENSATNVQCLPALVVTCSHAGALIKLSTSGAGDNWVYTCDGTESATMVTAGDGVGGSGSNILNVAEDAYDLISL